jgi:hypothetical protein
MKTTVVVAIAFLVAATLNSCDTGDTVTAPLASETMAIQKTAQCGGTIDLGEIIPFSQIEIDGRSSDQFAYLDGSVSYGSVLLPILVRDMVSLSLNLKASLHPLNGTEPIWEFAGKSTDQVALSFSGPTFLVKAYETGSGPTTATLFVRYEVTKCKVTIDEMWATKDVRSEVVPSDF